MVKSFKSMSMLLFLLIMRGISCHNLANHVDCPAQCSCIGNEMFCQDDEFPSLIPFGINHVTLKEVDLFKVVTKLSAIFNEEHWGNVTYLDISSKIRFTIVSYGLPSFTFLGLRSLRYLGIHCHKTMLLPHRFAFAGLDRLTTLDASHTSWWSMSDLLKALNTSTDRPILSRLTTLILGRSSFDYEEPINIDSAIISALATGRSIKYIDFSDINIGTLDFDSIWPLCETVEYVKLQRIKLGYAKRFYQSAPCRSLRTLDLTDSKITNMHEDIVHLLNDYCMMFGVYNGVENLIFDGCLENPPPWMNIHQTLMLSNCGFYNLKSLSLRKNNLKRLDMDLKVPRHIQDNFETLDLSMNVLTYVSPTILSALRNLVTLNISNNNLQKMQEDKFEDFQILLKMLSNLEFIYMSKNQLDSLPTEMFTSNKLLRYIDLSHNKLTDVSFNMESLTRLKFIDLRGNSLTTVSPTFQQQCELLNAAIAPTVLTGTRTTNGITKTNKSAFRIDLSSNQFICGCEHGVSEFIHWIHGSATIYRSHVTEYHCILNGETLDMLTSALSYTETFCNKQRLKDSLLISGGVLVIIATVITFLLFYLRWRIRKRRKFEQMLVELKDGRFPRKYLVFLSFCSEDADFVYDHIYNQLLEELAKIIERHADYVCIGDRHFRPGFPVHNEVVRCLGDSAVSIFVVSKNFCRKGWCQMEVGEAYEQGKPIILLMREHVDIGDMTPFFAKIFNRYTRAHWEDNDAGGHLAPGWNSLCTSLIALAGRGDRF